jgi:hypothetical protein
METMEIVEMTRERGEGACLIMVSTNMNRNTKMKRRSYALLEQIENMQLYHLGIYLFVFEVGQHLSARHHHQQAAARTITHHNITSPHLTPSLDLDPVYIIDRINK